MDRRKTMEKIVDYSLCGVGILIGAYIGNHIITTMRNSNIDPNYLKPKHAIIETLDINYDNLKETFFTYTLTDPQTGETKRFSIPLTKKNLEKIAQRGSSILLP